MENMFAFVTFVTLLNRCVMEKEGVKQQYSSLRVKPETLDSIQDVKLAFESTYLCRFTNDELVKKLVECIEDAEPAVWNNYLLIKEKGNGGNR